MNISLAVERYLDSVEGPDSNFLAWEDCYKAFRRNKSNPEELARELHLYLAAFGMLRKSSRLSNRSYRAHLPAIEILRATEFATLQDIELHDLSDRFDLVFDLKSRLKQSYGNLNPTETLLTKILMATICCTPAYDRYLRAGLKVHRCVQSLSKSGALGLARLFQDHTVEISKCRELLKSRRGCDYPTLRIVDIVLFDAGANS